MVSRRRTFRHGPIGHLRRLGETTVSEEKSKLEIVSDVEAEPDIRRAIEAILMIAIDPVPPSILAQLFEVKVSEIERICDSMVDQYSEAELGFSLVRIAGGYRFQSKPEQAQWVERFVLEGQSRRLTAAAMETLAIVAYKQPISRAQISAIRGVDVEGVMRNLQQRGLIDEVSRDTGPGNAVLYGTTQEFLERMGVDSVAGLPPLGEFVPGPEVVEALERSLRVVSDDVTISATEEG